MRRAEIPFKRVSKTTYPTRRHFPTEMDKPKAVAAAAHKLARLIYTMPTKGQDCYEERYRERVLWHLSQRAQKLGMQLIATEQPTPA